MQDEIEDIWEMRALWHTTLFSLCLQIRIRRDSRILEVYFSEGLTDSKELEPTWDANSCSSSQGIPVITRKPNRHYRVHNGYRYRLLDCSVLWPKFYRLSKTVVPDVRCTATWGGKWDYLEGGGIAPLRVRFSLFTIEVSLDLLTMK
jgi:hypothetical protein